MVVSAQMTRLVCCNHVIGLYENNEIQKMLFLVLLRRGFVHTIFITTLYITDDTDSLFSLC